MLSDAAFCMPSFEWQCKFQLYIDHVSSQQDAECLLPGCEVLRDWLQHQKALYALGELWTERSICAAADPMPGCSASLRLLTTESWLLVQACYLQKDFVCWRRLAYTGRP